MYHPFTMKHNIRQYEKMLKNNIFIFLKQIFICYS